MAILKDLIVHGSSRFLNKIYASEIQTPLIEAETGVFKKLKADDATVVGLLDVKGQLHTNSWSNSNIATIDGSFYITPTIGSDSGTVTITASTLVFSGTNYAVSSLYLGDGSSITWPQYSKVLVTGQILSNGEWIPLGTLLGQISGTATAASISINNIKDNKNQNSNVYATLVNSGVSSTDYRNLKISLYQRAASSTDFRPLGIYMTATGTNGRTFLDIYGGVESLSSNNNYGGFAEPNVRIGNLQGLPSVGGQTPSGWGIYTDNGYFKGIIAADQGYIGSGSRYWVIANYEDDSNPNNSRSYIYSYNGTDNGTDSVTSTVEGIYLGTDGIRNYKDSTHYVTIKDGIITALGVNLTGTINATEGNIGEATIRGGNLTVPAANISGKLTAATIDASKISTGDISSERITTNVLTALQAKLTSLNTNNLSAITANLGTITTGVIKHDTVGGTNGIWFSADTDTSSNVTIGNSTARKDWRLLVNNKFGVTKTGDLYASSANISGTITATDGTIGGINIVNGALDVSSISIGSLSDASNYAQKTDVAQAIDNIEVGGRNIVWNSNFHLPVEGTWSDWGSPTTREIVTINGENWMHIVTTANAFQGYQQNQANRNGFGEIHAGEKIIFSFDAYSKVDGQKGCIGIHWRDSNNINVSQTWASFDLTTTKKRYVSNVFTVPNNVVGFNVMVGQNVATAQELWITNIKGEKGNKATTWTPAPEDTQENINNISTVANTALGQSVWYAECSTAAGTAVKVATISPVTTNFVLTKGVTVNVKFTNTNSATNSSLQLNVNGTGAKYIKYIYNGSYTNIVVDYLKANQMYQFRYDGTYWIVQMMYNSNHVDRSRYAVSLYASEAIPSTRIAVLGLNNKLHILSSSSFYTSCPLLYIETAYSANDVTKPISRTTNYTYWGSGFNLTNTHSIQSATANTNVYIVGTLSGDIFTPNTTVLTCAEPTTENGLYYMLLGRMTSTTNAVLQAEHPIYVFKNGKFQRLEATTATSYITYIDANNGIKVHNESDTLNYLQLNSDAISMFRDSGEGLRSDEVLRIDNTGIRIGKNEGPHFSLTNDKLIGYGDIGNVYFEVGKGDNTTIQLFYGNGERTNFEIGSLFKTVYYVKKNDVDLINGTDYEIHVTAVRYNIYFKTEPTLNSTISVTYKDFYKSFIYTISSSSSGDIIVTSQQGPWGTATVITIQTHKSYEAESIYYKKSGTNYWQQWALEAEPESDTYKYSFRLGEGVNVGDQVKLSYSTEEHTELIPDTVTGNYTWDATHQNSTLLTVSSASQILSVSIGNTVLTEDEDYTLDGLLKYGYLILYNAPAVNEKIEIKLSPEEYNFEYQPTYFNFSNTNLENSVKGIGAASFGSENVNKGIFCFAEGAGNIVTGYASHVEGHNNIAAGSHSHVGGSNSLALGQNTFAYGDNLQATYLNSAAFGFYNSPENQLFSIGRGGYENAFSVNKDGNVQIGGRLLAGTTYTNNKPLFVFDTLIWTGQSISKNGAWRQTGYQLTRRPGYKAIAIAGIGIYNGTGGVNANWCVPCGCYIWSSSPYDLLDVYIWNQNTTAATSNTSIYVKILFIADTAI